MNNYEIFVQEKIVDVDVDVCYLTETIFLSGFGLLGYYIKYSDHWLSVFWRSMLSPFSE
jgi:hypothetical protein